MSAPRRFPGWVRYSGVGVELAGAIGGLALVGYWIDGRYGTSPWGMLGGVVIGMVGGLYNLVRESLDAVREARADDEIGSKDAGASTGGRADGD
jgi:ATP synthase protein I